MYDTFNINATLNPGSNILQDTDINVRVAGIDTSGKIPTDLIPELYKYLCPQGGFDPSGGYPTTTPNNGEFWIASSNGKIDTETYRINDWCVYLNGNWQRIPISESVTSVNNKTGNVLLTASDVGAIPTSYVNYTLGQTIPQGSIVRASGDGVITGASISNLSNSFNISTMASSPISINASTSTNVSTDGSSNLVLYMEPSSSLYTTLDNKYYVNYQSNGTDVPRPKTINFGEGLTVTSGTNNKITISTSGGGGSLDLETVTLHYIDGITNSASFIEQINKYIYDYMIRPIQIIITKNNISFNRFWYNHTRNR